MDSCVAFLRGVNVNGVTVKMAELRTALTELGLVNVRTVLATGNVIFNDDGEKKEIRKQQIETHLQETFGYDAWVVLLTGRELAALVEKFPFVRDDPQIQPYVVLGSDPATLKELQ
jgi:uncharacterized protein (DUF1697 family)